MAELDSKEDMQEFEVLTHEARRYRFRAEQLEAILRGYIALGLLIAAGALVYFAFSFLKIDLTPNQRMSLLVAGAGVSVSIMSAMLIFLRRQQMALRARTYEVVDAGFDIVREWSRFEEAGRQILLQNGQAFNARSPRSIVSTLESGEIIPPELAHSLGLALEVRNRIVHQVEPVPRQEMAEARSILAVANKRLDALSNGKAPHQVAAGLKPDAAKSAGLIRGGMFAGGGEATSITPERSGRKLNLDED